MTASAIFTYLCHVWLTTIWKNGTTNTFSAKLLLKRQNVRHGKNAWMHIAGNWLQNRRVNPALTHSHPGPSHLLPASTSHTTRLELPAILKDPFHKTSHTDNIQHTISSWHTIPNQHPNFNRYQTPNRLTYPISGNSSQTYPLLLPSSTPPAADMPENTLSLRSALRPPPSSAMDLSPSSCSTSLRR